MDTTHAGGLPPYGGSGLKFLLRRKTEIKSRSPSIRREWIEIDSGSAMLSVDWGLPPYGGSGLKFLPIFGAIMLVESLPPYGGSGLKFLVLSQ